MKYNLDIWDEIIATIILLTAVIIIMILLF